MKERRFKLEEMMRILKPLYLEKMDHFIKSEVGSPFDFLIYMACKDYNEVSEYNYEFYRANWKNIKEFTDNK